TPPTPLTPTSPTSPTSPKSPTPPAPAAPTGPTVNGARLKEQIIELQTSRPLAAASLSAAGFSVSDYAPGGWTALPIKSVTLQQAGSLVRIELGGTPARGLAV